MTATKYEALGEAFGAERRKGSDYHTACVGVANHLVNGLSRHMGIPRGMLEPIPLDESRKLEKDRKYTIPGAMHLDDDTYYHLGLILTVYEAPNIEPPHPVLLRFLIKGNGDRFLVKLNQEGKEHSVDVTHPSSFEPFFEYVYQRLKLYFTDGLERFLSGAAETERFRVNQRRIGFVP